MAVTYIFTWVDYTIFAAGLVISTLIGLYFGCYSNRHKSISDYLFSRGKTRIIPIAVSISVSHFSGATLLGVPADVYRYGAGIWLVILSYLVTAIAGVFIFLPVFFNSKITTVYEYLDKRFDQKTKILCFIFNFFGDLFMQPFFVYCPALVFATASGLNVEMVAFVLSLICIFYTAIGGLKTVIWTDIFQFVIIMVALLMILVLGFDNSNGFEAVWKIASEGRRLEVFNFDFDLTERDTVYSYGTGLATNVMFLITIHQSGTQKFLSLPSYRSSIWAMIGTVITASSVYTICTFLGIVAYAKYKDCDLLKSGEIKMHDQLLPYFFLNIAERVPGISGLFAAAICGAGLSSMSSNLNALVGVMFKDFVPIFLKKEIPEDKARRFVKLAVLVVGLLGSCLIFAIARMGEVFAMMTSFVAITCGPVVGIFLLATLFPRATSNGAFYGAIIGFFSTLGIVIPAKYYQAKGLIKYGTARFPVDGCTINGTSFIRSNITVVDQNVQPPAIFRISFYYYGTVAAIVTLIVGLAISYLAKEKRVEDRSLLHPIYNNRVPEKADNRSHLSYSTLDLKTLD